MTSRFVWLPHKIYLTLELAGSQLMSSDNDSHVQDFHFLSPFRLLSLLRNLRCRGIHFMWNKLNDLFADRIRFSSKSKMKFGNRCEGLICACWVVMRYMIVDRRQRESQSGCQLRANFAFCLTLQLDLGHDNENKTKTSQKRRWIDS